MRAVGDVHEDDVHVAVMVHLPVGGKVKGVVRSLRGMQIGELASCSHVPAKTIRYWEAIGVLAPPARAANGYRAYDPGVLDRLAFIRAAQAVGLTLGEIRGVIALRDDGETPCDHVRRLIARRASELGERIAELQRLQGKLEGLAARARRLDPADCDPTAVCHIISTSTPD
jgi:DNA-binding transcriptional MerR regulator